MPGPPPASSRPLVSSRARRELATERTGLLGRPRGAALREGADGGLCSDGFDHLPYDEGHGARAGERGAQEGRAPGWWEGGWEARPQGEEVCLLPEAREAGRRLRVPPPDRQPHRA